MDHHERTGGAATLRLNDSRVKEQIKRIQEFVWARHVDGSDNYDHDIDESEAIQTLDAFYSGIGNRNSPDQVYLGILLFESGFQLSEEEQEATFARAKRIFEFYKKVTGEGDWPAVEDRLEDIEAFFADKRGEEPVVDAPTVEEPVAEASASDVSDSAASVAVDEAPASSAEPKETTKSVRAEQAPTRVEAPAAPPEAPVAPEPSAPLESAAEEEERRVAEERAARREATEAFVADLEVVDGMQLVPAGTSVYGTEGREIYLDSFYIDRLPVTNAAYLRFVQETGYRSPRFVNDARFNNPDQPVVGVSLGDARQYARWAGKDLPSEQQWEKAARGGDDRPYPWGNDPPGTSDASFGQDPVEGRPSVVGKSLRNVSAFGVCDMAGGVWEWTSTRFAQDSDFQCVRGGCYNDPPEMLEVTYRLEAYPKDKSEAVGFRCVKNIHH